MFLKNKYKQTYYGKINKKILDKAKIIKLLICDIDGVMTSGLIYLDEKGKETNAFYARDGYGIKILLSFSIKVAVITGRNTKLIEDRCKILGIKYIYQGQSNKIKALKDLIKKTNISYNKIAYIGDDIIDWPVMNLVGLSVAVSNAHPFILKKAQYITNNKGGKGAVREICDLILIAKNKINYNKFNYKKNNLI
ncbi:3-deoxy-manno-octulosonate-8-phosphatase KdsC [Candidatus Purcelliella pentastirinorum]|uniref:3-deoxy-manno-octulosonate-8-phosphatase KdsC n=1 Tax=Candidatus Purcelliella pentastirinorum TaxID=472834 RepID=UPI002368AED7|nr:3-deoxy-manno-octulosonate-8-phosphatase KdsC [Candidatus Purcelliella pentastirinorum]WDI78959.1 3-deoxy-manno-octulosonate-8-phosphatase KdsC [Candidatus Purcelliella pentastirinorum]WDR80095.1 3-deoxy-manno-octulosonate-8-phosphatase KdsC [Candidatus Purcelliella pentastirinorum]